MIRAIAGPQRILLSALVTIAAILFAGPGVRETAVTSRDGGKSWQPAFDILFVKERARTG